LFKEELAGEEEVAQKCWYARVSNSAEDVDGADENRTIESDIIERLSVLMFAFSTSDVLLVGNRSGSIGRLTKPNLSSLTIVISVEVEKLSGDRVQ